MVTYYYTRSAREALESPRPLVTAPPLKKGPSFVYNGPSKKTRAKRRAKAARK